jgi:sugar phosphate isomerase/epimerase
MFLSLNPVITGGRPGWPDIVRLSARVGFRGADLNLGAAMKEGVDATRSLFEHLQLKAAAAGFPVDLRKDEDRFRETLKKLEPAAQFVAAVDCPRMVTWISASSETPKAELRKILKERFQASAEVLARSKVRLGLEFIGPLHARKAAPHEFIWRMDEMLAFAKECGPNVGLLLDIWHWHHAGATVADVLAAGRERIVHVHLSDAPDLPPDKIKDSERLLPGEGVINTTGFLKALQQIGYQDGMSVEVFGRGLKDMQPEEAARLAFQAADGVMRKAGLTQS